MRVATKITLSDSDKQILEKNTKSRAVSIRLAERSKIILLSAEGLENKDIAQKLGFKSLEELFAAIGLKSRITDVLV